MRDRAEKHLAGFAALTSRPSSDDECDLPEFDHGEYLAHARPANKPLFAIHFLNGRREVRSFQYAHLDSDSRYAPDCIRLRFLGLEPMEVRIHGRNLWKLYDCVHRHVMRWVMEAARDFAADGEAIISRVEFVPVKIDEREAEPTA